MAVWTIYANSDDASLLCYSSTSFSEARQGTGVFDGPYTGNQLTQVGYQIAGAFHYHYQAYLSFNTSGIDNNPITAQQIKIKFEGTNGSAVVEFRLHTWTTITSATFVPGSTLASKSLVASFSNPGTLSRTANTSGITKSARIGMVADTTDFRTGTQPGSNKNAYFAPVETSGTTNDPTLIITTTAADSTPPTITSSSTVTRAEGAQISHSLTADESVSWSIIGGTHAAYFTISGSTLQWAGGTTRPVGVYQVTVRATDAATNTTNQTINVSVIDVTAPTITSNNSAYLPVGDALNHVLTANEQVTWALVDSFDIFSINGSVLNWANNVQPVTGSYPVTVSATDTSGNSTLQVIGVVVYGGLVKPRISGNWPEKPVKVRLSTAWLQKPAKVSVSGSWVLV